MSHRSLFLTVVSCLLLFVARSGVAGEDAYDADWNTRSALEAYRVATLSAETGGRIVKIHGEMGMTFRKDDILIELNDRLARAALASARASLAAATAALAAADGMYARKSASQIELEEAKKGVAEAESRLELALHENEACRIVAPFDGRVAEVLVNEHELVEKGRPVISLMDDSRLTAKFLFPEERFGDMSIGDMLEIRIPVVGVVRQARVSHIAPVIEPASRTLDVWASVDNADSALRPGMTVLLTDESPAERRP